MAREFLRVHELEAGMRLVGDDLIVHGLAAEVFFCRVEGDGRDGVHGGLGDVLHHNRNAVLPNENLFIIRSGHQLLPVLAKRDRVHGAQVLVVLLDDLEGVLRVDGWIGGWLGG